MEVLDDPQTESYLSHSESVVLSLNPFFILECVLVPPCPALRLMRTGMDWSAATNSERC